MKTYYNNNMLYGKMRLFRAYTKQTLYDLNLVTVEYDCDFGVTI